MSKPPLKAIALTVAKGKNKIPDAPRESFRYHRNMTSADRKRDSSVPSSRRLHVRGKKEPGAFRCDPLRDESKVDVGKVINNQQMLAFQHHLENWVKENATDDEGNQWSQAQIAEKLGITQPELSGWKRDTARPGIVTLIQLRKKFRTSIEVMLGLPPVRVR